MNREPRVRKNFIKTAKSQWDPTRVMISMRSKHKFALFDVLSIAGLERRDGLLWNVRCCCSFLCLLSAFDVMHFTCEIYFRRSCTEQCKLHLRLPSNDRPTDNGSRLASSFIKTIVHHQENLLIVSSSACFFIFNIYFSL